MNQSDINLHTVYKLLKEYRNTLIIIFAWIIASLLSSDPFNKSLEYLVRFFLYPINLILFNTPFSQTSVPYIFFIFIPLLFVLVFGFIYLISTED